MPVKFIKHPDLHSSLGIWEITESLEWLRYNVPLSGDEQHYYLKFRAEDRKKQWLAYRYLLMHMLKDDQVSIIYDETGKPMLKNSRYHLSVSHAGSFAAAIIHDSKPVGIDIEQVSTRILKVEDRFLSENEQAFLGQDRRLDQLCLLWCAKEALYKMHGSKKLDFKTNLFVEPFPVQAIGTMTGSILLEGRKQSHMMNFMSLGDYYLVFVIKEL